MSTSLFGLYAEQSRPFWIGFNPVGLGFDSVWLELGLISGAWVGFLHKYVDMTWTQINLDVVISWSKSI